MLQWQRAPNGLNYIEHGEQRTLWTARTAWTDTNNTTQLQLARGVIGWNILTIYTLALPGLGHWQANTRTKIECFNHQLWQSNIDFVYPRLVEDINCIFQVQNTE